MVPVGGGLWDRTVQIEGVRFRADESDVAGFNAVAPGYLPRSAHRSCPAAFDARDTATSPTVAIVNESFAHFFGRDAALGRRDGGARHLRSSASSATRNTRACDAVIATMAISADAARAIW
jgi:hypothetical protein